MWKCVKCEQELGDDWHFCWRCGTRNDELLDLFLESYGKTLPDDERNYILNNYDLFVETYGKDIFDVHHNIELELKRKYKHLYWINRNGVFLFFTIIVFWIVLGYFIADKINRLNTLLIFLTSYVLMCSIITYFLDRFLKKTGREISAYEYYMRHKSKREWEKRQED